jgi:hypothetical protein
MKHGISLQAVMCIAIGLAPFAGLIAWLLIRAHRSGQLWSRGTAAGKTRSQEAFDVGRPPKSSAPPTPRRRRRAFDAPKAG